jgi:two-component system sensor histidine kinase SenX3
MRDLVAQAATIEDNCVLVVLIDRSAEVEATQARRDFVSNVGHELVTPVTSLRLIAQALTASAEDPAMVRDFAGRLTRVTTQLDHMTASMLTLARAQEAPLPDQMRPIDIGDVIDKAVATLANEAEHAGIKLQRKKRGKAVVMGDADALETAVENLVSNAIHYSPSGGRVTITTGRDDSAGTATISVVDQGIGVDPAEQDRIFERFYRTDSARARRTGGTGLGLAIVKHTALAHGGSVRVDSRPGIGSTFALILPQAGAPDTEEEA